MHCWNVMLKSLLQVILTSLFGVRWDNIHDSCKGPGHGCCHNTGGVKHMCACRKAQRCHALYHIVIIHSVLFWHCFDVQYCRSLFGLKKCASVILKVKHQKLLCTLAAWCWAAPLPVLQTLPFSRPEQIQTSLAAVDHFLPCLKATLWPLSPRWDAWVTTVVSCSVATGSRIYNEYYYLFCL